MEPCEIEEFTSMTDENLRNIAEILTRLEKASAEDLYLVGKLEIRNGDIRLGYCVNYEDWWIFIPDFAELPA